MSTTDHDVAALQIGDWRVEPSRHEVYRDGETRQLRRLAMDVLVQLAREAPETVSTERLIDAHWPHEAVGDHALKSVISELRKALGDDARNPRYIRTIPKRGYQLLSPVTPAEPLHPSFQAASHADVPSASDGMAQSEPQIQQTATRIAPRPGPGLRLWLSGTAAAALVALIVLLIPQKPAPVDRSISVLPILAIDDSPGATAYGAALTEELRSLVAGYQELRTVVEPRAATPGDVTGASYALGGSIQDLGDRVRLRALLTRVPDGEVVWSDSFDRGVAGVQDDPASLAATVGRFVRYQIVEDQRCQTVRQTSPVASAADAYCEALAEAQRSFQVGSWDVTRVASLARRAIELDPDITHAYVILADNFLQRGVFGLIDRREAIAQAHNTLDQGLARAPADPSLLAMKGDVYTEALNYPAGDASERAAIAADPLHPDVPGMYQILAFSALCQGNMKAALENLRRSLKINDASAYTHAMYSQALLWDGQYRRVLEVTEQGLPLVEVGFTRMLLLATKTRAHAFLSDPAAANATLDEAVASVGPDNQHFLIGLLMHLGRADEAHVRLTKLEAMEDPPALAMIYAYAGLRDDRVFEWLHKAIDQRVGIMGLRLDPAFDAFRGDPRWADVMAHLEAEEMESRSGHRVSESGWK